MTVLGYHGPLRYQLIDKHTNNKGTMSIKDSFFIVMLNQLVSFVIDVTG